MSPPAMPELLAAIVEQATDAIVFADRDGIVRIWNSGAERLFGYAKGEAIGRSLDLIIPERLRAAHWAGFERAIATGTTKHDGRAMLTRSMHKDGSKLYVDVSFALVRDARDAVAGSLAIARNANERHAAEAASRQRIDALQKALEAASPPIRLADASSKPGGLGDQNRSVPDDGGSQSSRSGLRGR